MIPCTAQLPLPRVPPQVQVIRAGRTVRPPLALQRGDELLRVSAPGRFTLALGEERLSVLHGRIRLSCEPLHPGRRRSTRTLAPELLSGRIELQARGAVAATPEAVALPDARTRFVLDRDPRAARTRIWTLDEPLPVQLRADPRLRLRTRITYTALADRRGLRLDIWPFPLSPLQRATGPADALPAFWADGRSCSVGCTAPGTTPGWPLRPFHRQHAIRAGINELRPSNFHVAVDIEANDLQPVYALESGYAHIRYPGTGDVNVDVGRFMYWHINPAVREGQYVTAYRTLLGQVLRGFGHVALSEGTTSDYLNPLRPGGSLQPYHDSEPPVIGVPRVFPDGRVTVAAFDPQSFVERKRYETPVLAPSSLAWRLYDGRGRALTGLEWAMRGSQNYPPGLRSTIFAPGAYNPGFHCFLTQVRCIPNWDYWLAGGLAPPLPLSRLHAGGYRLVVYAWDWAGNTAALDYRLRLPLAHAASVPAEFGPLRPRFDYP